MGYGISARDLNRLREFVTATDRWSAGGDFREICRDYIHFSHEAMTVKIAGIPAARCVMALRSTPGLPDWLAVNETSQRHYENFSRGELSAYLHLCGEQGTNLYFDTFESMARKDVLTDDDVRAFLQSFHLSAPVSTDASAIQSVRKLLRDVDAAKPFEIRKTCDAEALLPHIQAIAAEQHLPIDPKEMTSQQQLVALNELDSRIAHEDLQLWRTKQATDFLSGVWGQAYAQIYRDYLIQPILTMHRIGLWSTWVLLGVVGMLSVKKRQKLSAIPSPLE